MCFRVVCFVFSVALNWRGSLLVALVGCCYTRALPRLDFARIAFWLVSDERINLEMFRCWWVRVDVWVFSFVKPC